MEKLCTSHIVARSFGIGLGAKTALPIDISHLKYGYLRRYRWLRSQIGSEYASGYRSLYQ